MPVSIYFLLFCSLEKAAFQSEQENLIETELNLDYILNLCPNALLNQVLLRILNGLGYMSFFFLYALLPNTKCKPTMCYVPDHNPVIRHDPLPLWNFRVPKKEQYYKN